MSNETSNPQNIVVNVTSGQRGYQIIATLLLCGALGAVAWALAENGWIEMAATSLTMFLVQLTRMLFSNGLLCLPESGEGEFKGTVGLVKTMAAEYRNWMGKSPIWRLVIMAAAYTVVFMVARFIVTWALGVFTNIWIAGAACAVVASLIIFPSLIGDAVKAVSGKAKGLKGSTKATASAPTTDSEA